MNSTLQNILTFGASGRIEKAQETYDSLYRDYKDKVDEYNSLCENFKGYAAAYLPLQIQAQKLARKVKKFIPTKENERENVIQDIGFSPEDLAEVETSLSAGEIALNSLKGVAGGVIAGAAAPAAIMGAVTAFGTAGTGVAISSLFGAAQSQAALAALGGGTLAAGGGGVAAGSAVLSASVPVVGIAIAAVAVPVFSHLSANKKIKAIEEESLKVVKETDAVESQKIKVNYCISRVIELTESLKKAELAFKKMYRRTCFKVYPFGFISKLIKGKGKRFSEKDKLQVSNLLNAAKAMLQIRDTNFMTEIESDCFESEARYGE